MSDEEYPEQNAEDLMGTIGMENQQLKNDNLKLQSALTGAGFNDPNEQNSIHERLETDKILERIEHFLKGDQITIGSMGSYYVPPTKNVLAIVKEDEKAHVKFYIQELVKDKKGTEITEEVLVKIKSKTKDIDEEGNEVDVYVETDIFIEDSSRILKKVKQLKLKDCGYEYVQVLDEEKKPFNEYGVSELMRIMSMYVNKETILSCYKEERIMEILGDLGNALADFLYSNYEKMGMDTKFKESKFQLITINLLHVVENCYRRALGGSEQKHLNIKGVITQSGYLGGVSGQAAMKERWNPLKPKSW